MKFRRYPPIFAIIALSLLLSLACTIPFLTRANQAQPTDTASAEEMSGYETVVAPDVSGAVLTEAAATVYAPLAATWTALAGGAPLEAQATPTPEAQPTPEGGLPGGAPPVEATPQAGGLIQPIQPNETAPAPGVGGLIQPIQPGQAAPGGGAPVAGDYGLLPPIPTATPFWAPVLGEKYSVNAPAAPAAGPGPVILPVQPPSAQPALPQPTPAGGLILPVQPQGQPAAPAPSAPGQGGLLPIIPPAEATAPAPEFIPQPAQTSPSFSPLPLAGFDVPIGRTYRVMGVNLPLCGGVYVANFLVANGSALSFESASITVENQTTGVVLNQTGPLNAPFLENDESCAAGGLSQLPPNTSLFVGASLGAPDLAGQTIRFEMHLCTQDNLAGECHNLPIIFVVP